MDFNAQKPSHIFALLLVIGSIVLIFVFPIITFFMSLDAAQLIESIDIPEIVAIQSQLLVIAVFILVPFAWYYFVNKSKLKEIFSRIKLVSDNIDMAFLWGIVAAIAIFVIIFVIELALIRMGHNPSDLSNFPELKSLFSWPTLFFLVIFQPIGEEIYFRGFLFDKIEGYAGSTFAVFITAFLFGIAHLSYGKEIPVLMIILMGIILGYVVYKTRNLFSSLIAHVVFNATSFILAYLGLQLLEQMALIL